jgi:hypothetical protein
LGAIGSIAIHDPMISFIPVQGPSKFFETGYQSKRWKSNNGFNPGKKTEYTQKTVSSGKGFCMRTMKKFPLHSKIPGGYE